MIKELLLAIIFGLLIGFGLTGTFYFVRQNKNQSNNTPNIVVPPPGSEDNNSINVNLTPTIPSSNPNLEITSPQNYDIIATSKTTIEGQSNPNSLIIITTPLKNYHLSANIQGKFSQEIVLESGFNAINLTSIDENDQEYHLEFFLTYSTTKLE